MLREQNLAQRVRGREMDGAHVEGAWLFLKCKEKSPEALEQACDLICIFKRRLCRVENALQYVCVLGGGGGEHASCSGSDSRGGNRGGTVGKAGRPC